MPPSKGKVWIYFVCAKNASGKIMNVTCKFCGQVYTFPNATKMRKHLIRNCTECSESIKDYLKESYNETGKTLEVSIYWNLIP